MIATKEKIELKLIKTLWGIDDPISPELFRSIKNEGYHGVEVIRLAYLFDKEMLVKSLNESGLTVVCQIHTAGGYIHEESGEYVYCGAYDVAVHKEDFRKQLEECKELIRLVDEGGFINVHGGVDAWSNEEAVQFLEYCLESIEQIKPEVTVTFETHRQRLFGSPFQARDLFLALQDAKLRLNADLSHWYCACERVFNAEDDRDKWWPALVSSLAERCSYIHARFGWAQGPQLADPSAVECENDRILQVKVWKILIGEQKKKHLSTGLKNGIFVSPEYGPAPYMAIKPHTQEPIASLPQAVSFTKKLIEEIFEEST